MKNIINDSTFTIWIGLEDIKEKEMHDINLKSYVWDIISESTVDSELIYKIKVVIPDTKRIKELVSYLDDDVVIYNENIITTVSLAREMGLI